MYKKNDRDTNEPSESENIITSTNGYNENTIYKPSNSSIKLSKIRQAQIDLAIVDELYREPISLELGGYLESED